MKKYKDPHHATEDPYPADALGKRLCRVFGRYRWKFIYADTPVDSETKAKWYTETRYKIKHRVLFRQWQDSEKLVGVRFDDDTHYGVIDIDHKSKYHPQNGSGGLDTIQAALETIGIARTVLISSSWSNGLHLYLPLPEPINTFNFAVAIKGCLEAQGLELGAGQLEVFPNPKPYGNTITTEYLGHRLPLQPGTGSHLLDQDLTSVSDKLSDFFNAWDSAAASQDIEFLSVALSVARDNRRKRPRRRLNKVDAWGKDLQTVISTGWTDHGQTNSLLKQIATYGIVFLGESGDELADYITEIAVNSPGYKQWCNHQHEIKQRARAWANSVEKFYWPLGTHPKRDVANNIVPFQYNQRISANAGQKIRAAVEELELANSLPEKPTARAKAIHAIAGSSFHTLYSDQHKGLWHPDHYQQCVILEPPVESAISETKSEREPDPRKLQQTEELQTKPKLMKCVPPKSALKKSKTSSGGVRGEDVAFPQDKKKSTPQKVNNRHRQAPIYKSIDAETQRLIEVFQARIRELRWEFSKIQAFVEKILPGKRPSQLTNDDRILLLYHLSNEPP